MAWLWALAALGVAAAAVVFALRVRQPLIAPLGSPYRMRFFAVQAGPINVILFGVIWATAGRLGWADALGSVLGVFAYGVVFYLYSVSNVDWTLRKFHAVGSPDA